MLPKKINDIFKEYAEDEYNLHVIRTDYSATIFSIDLALDIQDINDKGAISQEWKIEITGHVKNQISFDSFSLIEIKKTHPLLWEFTDTQCQLYFSGLCKDPTKLFFDLYLTHKRLFGAHQCFNVSFGEDTSYFKLFQYSNGLLTQGSKKLMEIYADCLKRNGLDFTIIGERSPSYWNGEQFIAEDQDLRILFLGETYIIAKDFSFVQQG